MVATFLQAELAEELGKIFEGFRLKNPQGKESRINIFEQELPIPEPLGQEETSWELLENGLAEGQTAPDPYPFIIVRVEDGEIKDEASAQEVSLMLAIGTYDPDYGKQGHKDVMNIIAKIYERFAKMPVLNSRYTMQFPVLWTLQEEETYPFYFGGMNMTFEIAAIRREDPYA